MSMPEDSGFNQWDRTDEAFKRERPNRTPRDRAESGPTKPDEPSSILFTSTTPSLEGWSIQRYLGVVCGEAAIGTGFGKEVPPC